MSPCFLAKLLRFLIFRYRKTLKQAQKGTCHVTVKGESMRYNPGREEDMDVKRAKERRPVGWLGKNLQRTLPKFGR